MADKRRRARVQGGWASSSSSKDSKNSSQASQTANKAEKKSPVAYNFNPNVEVYVCLINLNELFIHDNIIMIDLMYEKAK